MTDDRIRKINFILPSFQTTNAGWSSAQVAIFAAIDFELQLSTTTKFMSKSVMCI